MILTGGKSGQQLLLASFETQKSIKNLNSLVNSPNNVITFEQAQQMDLIKSNEYAAYIACHSAKTYCK